MDLDTALEIVNDPALVAFCDYTHATLQRPAGGYEFGRDERYDVIVLAFAFVAVELALNEEMFEFVPRDRYGGGDSGGSKGDDADDPFRFIF